MSWLKTLSDVVTANGVHYVTLSEAIDKGLARENYTVVPHSCKRVTKVNNVCLGRRDEFKVKETDPNHADNKEVEVKAADPILARRINTASGFVTAYYAEGKAYRNLGQSVLSDDNLREYFAANFAWVDKAKADTKMSDDKEDILWAVLAVQLVFGLIDADEDAEVLYLDDTAAAATITDAQYLKISLAVQANMATAKLLCAAAALNHYKLNHTTGQGRVAGFVQKVASTIDSFGSAPRDDKAAANAYWAQLTDFLYLALHRVGKRNGAFALMNDSPSLAGVFYSFQTRPAMLKKDDFVALRAKGAPAGAAKIPVLHAALKMMAATRLLLFAPIGAEMKTLGDLSAQLQADPILCHAGAAWYTKYLRKRIDWNQNNDDVTKLISVCAVFLKHVAPKSTLADSPQFNDVYETAKGEYAAFDTICGSYAMAKTKTVSSTYAEVIVKNNTGSVMVTAAEDALKVMADPALVAQHGAAALVVKTSVEQLLANAGL